MLRHFSIYIYIFFFFLFFCEFSRNRPINKSSNWRDYYLPSNVDFLQAEHLQEINPQILACHFGSGFTFFFATPRLCPVVIGGELGVNKKILAIGRFEDKPLSSVHVTGSGEFIQRILYKRNWRKQYNNWKCKGKVLHCLTKILYLSWLKQKLISHKNVLKFNTFIQIRKNMKHNWALCM